MSSEIDAFSAAVKLLAGSAESRLDAHPSPEELAAYHQGQMDETSARRLQGHLELCRECTGLLLDLAEMVAENPPETAENPPGVAENPPGVAENPPEVAEDPPEMAESPPGMEEDPPDTDRVEAQAWSAMRRRLADASEPPSPSPAAIGQAYPAAPPRFAYALAAVACLAVLALGTWNLALHRALEDQIAPRPNIEIHDLVPRGFARTERQPEAPIELAAGSERFVLILNPSEKTSLAGHRAKVFDRDDRLVWSSDGLAPTAFGNFTLELSRRFLAEGHYRIDLFSLEGDSETLLDSYEIDLLFH